MALITGIRAFRGLIIIDVDGVKWLTLRKTHFDKSPLEVGDSIDPEQYADHMAAAQAADCYEAALTVLDSAAQTQRGMVKKLIGKGYVPAAAEAAAQRLAESGLIDDARYAERIAQSQLQKPVGAYAVRRKLRAKNLSEDDVEAALSGFDEAQQADACRSALPPLLRKYASLPKREARAKLSQALARRGFAWDVIADCLDEALSDEEF